MGCAQSRESMEPGAEDTPTGTTPTPKSVKGGMASGFASMARGGFHHVPKGMSTSPQKPSLVDRLRSRGGPPVFDQLPDELVRHIFTFLDQRDVYWLCLVCKRFSTILMSEDVFWKHLTMPHAMSPLEVFNMFQEPRMTALESADLNTTLTPKLCTDLLRDLPRTVTKLSFARCNVISKQLLTDEMLLRFAQHLPKLEELDVSGCYKITEEGFIDAARQMFALRSLHLTGLMHITDQAVVYIGKCFPHLRKLTLRDCAALTPTAMRYLADGNRELEELDVSNNKWVNDAAVRHVSGVVSLRSLSLEGCARITDASIRSIAGKLHALETLNLYGCKLVEDSGLIHLQQVASLRRLLLGENGLVTSATLNPLYEVLSPEFRVQRFSMPPSSVHEPDARARIMQEVQSSLPAWASVRGAGSIRKPTRRGDGLHGPRG